MTLVENILVHGTVYAVLFTLYLLTMMRGVDPRVWAFSDYPKEITDHVPPQTIRERRIGAYLGIPFFIITIGFPLVSTMMLEVIYGGTLPLLDAFLNIFAILMFGNFADLLILDLLIVGTITPDWVIISGTEHMRDKEYKDFRRYHAKVYEQLTKVGHSCTFYYRCLYYQERTVRCRVSLGQEPSPQGPTLQSPRVARGQKTPAGEVVRHHGLNTRDAASMNQEPNIDHGMSTFV